MIQRHAAVACLMGLCLAVAAAAAPPLVPQPALLLRWTIAARDAQSDGPTLLVYRHACYAGPNAAIARHRCR